MCRNCLIDRTYMIGRRDYVEIVGAVSRRIAAEKYIGTVELETVEKSVEDLRRN